MFDAPEVERIDEATFTQTFSTTCINLASSTLNSTISGFSDEYFASASNLLTPTPPIRRAGYFVETGAWYDGWETRRHNREPYDWVTIKLGVPSATIHGLCIDTTYFNGNHAPSISLDGRADEGDEWTEILGQCECGPSQKHFWAFKKPTMTVGEVRLRMWPDGGIARVHLMGKVLPPVLTAAEGTVDLASVAMGAVAQQWSDQHFGVAGNLIMPGRGKDMGDGWETKRSREKGHTDWVVVKLGSPGVVEEVLVDTLHFRGNFPQAVEVYAATAGESDSGEIKGDDKRWEKIVEKSECQKDTEHRFKVEGGKVYTHVKMVIIPDGGVKRLRVFGKRSQV
ncbi:allantoicase [Ascodesmis nigricans]|uniref:Allantoicase n=1 Tax=Ascodesmis nigricans TaxID=341454 RepID=A0A4S2N1E5_9PEZI|nr:allantoicase [Ascodesmis nigricans]